MVGLVTVRVSRTRWRTCSRSAHGGAFPPSSSSRCCARPTRCAATSPATTIPRRAARGPAASLAAPSDGSPPPAVVAEPAPAAPAAGEPLDPRARRRRSTAARPRRRDRSPPPPARARARRGRGGAGQTVSDELDLGERLFDGLKDAAIGMRTLPLSSITAPLPRAVRDLARRGQGGRARGQRRRDRARPRHPRRALRAARPHAPQRDRATESRRRASGGSGKPARAPASCAPSSAAASSRSASPTTAAAVAARWSRARQHGSLADGARPARVLDGGRGDASFPGRGVGLDAVKRQVEAFGGTLEVRSEPGRGTQIILRLPLALALIEVLLVERGGNVFGLPLASVEEAVSVENRSRSRARPAIELRGRSIAARRPRGADGRARAASARGSPAIVVTAGGRRIAAICDRLLGQDEVVVKPLGSLLASARGYLGAAILGDGRIALLLDPASLVPRQREHAAGSHPHPSPRDSALAPKVLVVEDSFTVRELQRSILQAAGYRVRDRLRRQRGPRPRLGRRRDRSRDHRPRDAGDERPRADARDPRPRRELVPAGRDRHVAREATTTAKRGIEAGADAYMVKASFDQHALLETVERLVGT